MLCLTATYSITVNQSVSHTHTHTLSLTHTHTHTHTRAFFKVIFLEMKVTLRVCCLLAVQNHKVNLVA
jgi:hypothetical protein